MNQYGSVVDRFIARNVLEQAINPPAAFSIANASWVNSFFRAERGLAPTFKYINPNSNMVLKRAGLFCNFADGLVINGTNRVQVSVAFQGLTLLGAVATGTLTAGSRALTGGTSFTTELAVGTVIFDANGQPYRVASVTDNANAVLDERAVYNSLVSGSVYSVSTFFGVRFPGFFELNQMYDLEFFAPVASYGSAAAAFIFPYAIIGNEDTTATVDYMSKTISTSYAGDTARFDVYADIEFTRA